MLSTDHEYPVPNSIWDEDQPRGDPVIMLVVTTNGVHFPNQLPEIIAPPDCGTTSITVGSERERNSLNSIINPVN